MKPLSVVVLDARAMPIAVAPEDSWSLGRFDIAWGKAMGCLVFNSGSRNLAKFAAEQERDQPLLRRHPQEGRCPDTQQDLDQ